MSFRNSSTHDKAVNFRQSISKTSDTVGDCFSIRLPWRIRATNFPAAGLTFAIPRRTIFTIDSCSSSFSSILFLRSPTIWALEAIIWGTSSSFFAHSSSFVSAQKFSFPLKRLSCWRLSIFFRSSFSSSDCLRLSSFKDSSISPWGRSFIRSRSSIFFPLVFGDHFWQPFIIFICSLFFCCISSNRSSRTHSGLVLVRSRSPVGSRVNSSRKLWNKAKEKLRKSQP